MKFSTFILLGRHLVVLVLISSLLIACQSAPSAEDYASRLCTCYGTDSEAALQLQAGTIDRLAYEQLVLDCMGEENPLKELEEDPKALLEFKAAFLDALQASCPDVARSMGY